MENNNKIRPLRIFSRPGANGRDELFIYGDGAKKKKLLTKMTRNEAQKHFMNKLTGKMSADTKISPYERPLYNPRFESAEGIKTKPLEDSKSIPRAEDTDEGLKLKRRYETDEERLKIVRKKLFDGRPLTDEEKRLVPLAGVVDAKQEEEQKLRDEDIRNFLIEYQLNPDAFPYRAWNGPKHGHVKYIIRYLKWLLDRIFGTRNVSPLTPHETARIFGALNGYHLPDYPPNLQQYRAAIEHKNNRDTFSNQGLPNSNTRRLYDAAMEMRRIYTNAALPLLTPPEFNRMIAASQATLGEQKIIPEPLKIGTGPQSGGGKLPALYNDEIEDYFDDEKKYPHFGGVIAADQIKDLPKKLPIGFIMNLDKADQPGSHWVAVYINGDSVEYFDPLADPPSAEFKRDIKKYLESMNVPILMKFKVNKIKWQDDKTVHCGWFCIQWLDNRFHGIPFADSTHFTNKSGAGEEKLKKEFDYI